MEDTSLDTAPAAPALASAPGALSGSLAGQTIGQYELLRELGRGGMGRVYLALDTKLGRQVALKLLARHCTSDPARVRRFRQEARAISTLNHPNILTIHEIGEAQTDEGATHFLATEYVEGRTLRALLAGGGLALGELLELAIQATGALAAAHQAGIIHRDIKPENIMLRPDGLVKVLDFGLAKLTGRRGDEATGRRGESEGSPYLPVSPSPSLTEPGTLLGTISYMSPEQARGQEVDARSDIFSLGVVLYELLTGRAPFAGMTTGDVLVSILEREPPTLQHYAPQLPAALQRIVNRALAKDRAQRYQHAADLLAELKELKQELELAARLNHPGKTVAGDTPAGAVSLSLRVGQAAVDDSETAKAAFTTQAAARPTDKSRQLLTRLAQVPGQRLAWAALALALLSALLFKFWPAARPDAALDTVAVLPFVNVGGAAAAEYLPEGITENLMQSLQQVPGLRVMARGTVYTYKGREVDPRQVGRELNVRAVITGRVQRQGDRLLIAAELAETRDGTQLWSERYQKPLSDLATTQEQLAREISFKLRPQLGHVSSAQTTPQAGRTPTINSDAYQLYLQGRYQQRQLTRASGEQALALFNQALALAPNFALPHSGIALVYQDFSSQYLPPREAQAKARQAALAALALDEQLAEAHYALAQTKVYEWDWAGAEQEFNRALALNPDLIDARYYFAGALVRLHRFAEAEALFGRTVELDPLSPQVCQGLSNVLYFARQYERAAAQAHKTLALSQRGIWASTAHRILGGIALQHQHYAEGLEAYRQALEASRTESNQAWLAYAYARAGRPAEARATFRELQAAAKQHWVSPVYFARMHLGLGEYEQALARLREAYAAQSDHLLHLSVDPIYDPLRQEPRFVEMLKGIGLPQ